VDVKVRDGLKCRNPIVLEEMEAGGLQRVSNGGAHGACQPHGRDEVLVADIVERLGMGAGNDKGVTVVDRIDIQHGEGPLVFRDDQGGKLSIANGAKDARHSGTLTQSDADRARNPPTRIGSPGIRLAPNDKTTIASLRAPTGETNGAGWKP
jgi:hypothetical protein